MGETASDLGYVWREVQKVPLGSKGGFFAGLENGPGTSEFWPSLSLGRNK